MRKPRRGPLFTGSKISLATNLPFFYSFLEIKQSLQLYSRLPIFINRKRLISQPVIACIKGEIKEKGKNLQGAKANIQRPRASIKLKT